MKRSEGITVEAATRITTELVRALERIMPQLSAETQTPGFEQLARVVSCPANRLLIARDRGGAVVGTLTLVIFPAPSGTKARIEDIVVDEASRGGGVGTALVEEALRLAAAGGAKAVELTSAPAREAANRLYQRTGFKLRKTNVYRYALGRG